MIPLAEWTAFGKLASPGTADPEFLGHVDGAFVPEPFDAAVEALLAEGAEESLTFTGLSLDGGR